MSWRTENLIPDKIYTFSDVQREIGIHRNTCARMRDQGRLKVTRHPSRCTGVDLKAAICNEHPPRMITEIRKHNRKVKEHFECVKKITKAP